MGAKKRAAKQHSNFNYANVVDIKPFQKKTKVTILPRNKNQESYVIKLLDLQKDIVWMSSKATLYKHNSIGV